MLAIPGTQTVSGTVSISGSKNAALPMIAAALLFRNATLRNVPDIGDVRTFLQIVESLGVAVSFENGVLKTDTSAMSDSGMRQDLVKKIRASILLVPAMLERFGSVEIPYPGGCNIGKRPIGEHTGGLSSLGYRVHDSDSGVRLSGKAVSGDLEIGMGFAVTATENLIMASVLRNGKTRLVLSAIEPHVMNLVAFLNAHGANITVRYDHTIEIDGVPSLLETAEFDVISDYIESGTFVILGAIASKDFLDIRNARQNDLRSFLGKCREAGVKFEDLGNDTLRVYRSVDSLKAVKMQTNVFPGFPTDLQSPFAILMTQCEGVSRIQEIMFEGRLNWLVEIEKMKGHVALMNPHEALVFGKTRLRGTTVSSWDLRAGVAMILAGLVAEGETRITNVEYIERGYEDIVGKIRSLGAVVEKVESVS